MAAEKPLSKSTALFIGKTIKKMDARACNNVEFLFTDGTRVALHINCDHRGLPVALACTECCEITDGVGIPLTGQEKDHD